MCCVLCATLQGGFIHGFRYTARVLFRMLEAKYHNQAWPGRVFDNVQEWDGEGVGLGDNGCNKGDFNAPPAGCTCILCMMCMWVLRCRCRCMDGCTSCCVGTTYVRRAVNISACIVCSLNSSLSLDGMLRDVVNVTARCKEGFISFF